MKTSSMYPDLFLSKKLFLKNQTQTNRYPLRTTELKTTAQLLPPKTWLVSDLKIIQLKILRNKNGRSESDEPKENLRRNL